MKTLEIIHLNSDESKHSWEKINLMTIVKKGKKPHDIWKCKKCGCEAFLFTLGMLQIETSSQKKIDKFKKCPKDIVSMDDEPWDIGNSVTIKIVKISNNAANNLTTDSIHKIVKPPSEYLTKYPNSESSVWVMGIDEEIRILSGEFKFNK